MTRIAIALRGEEASGGGEAAGGVALELTPGLLQPRLITRGRASAHIALVAGGAMLLGGDRTSVEVRVGAGCTLEIEDIGGTVAYESRGTRSRFDVAIRVEAGGTLIWRAHPFVVADGAAVDRDTTIRLGDGAQLLLRETLVLGRTGERGGEIAARMDARTTAGAPMLLEDVELSGTEPLAGVLGTHRVLDSAVRLGSRPAAQAQGCSDGEVTMLDLDAPGTVARTVADQAHRTGIDAVMKRWAAQLSAARR